MTLRWADERYIKLYTRDTAEWLEMSGEARGLFCLLLRAVDRAGLLTIKKGARSLATILRWDISKVEPLLNELIAEGCVEIHNDTLIIPNFIEAQEVATSDAQRKREQRERSLAHKRLKELEVSRDVTPCHEPSRSVTTRVDKTRQDKNIHTCARVDDDPRNGTRSPDQAGSAQEIGDLEAAAVFAGSHSASPENGDHSADENSPESRCDSAKLQQAWIQATGVIAGGDLLGVAHVCEDAARVQTPPADPTSYTLRAIEAFAHWVDSITPSKRPRKSPDKFVKHFARIQEILDGRRAAEHPVDPPVRKEPYAGRDPPMRPQPPPVEEIAKRWETECEPPPPEVRAWLDKAKAVT